MRQALCTREKASTPAGAWLVWQAFFAHKSEAQADTHLESIFSSHRRAAASLLDQSELHGSSVAKANTCTGALSPLQTLSIRVSETWAGTHLESASTLHHGAPASLISQIFMTAPLQRQTHTLVAGWCDKALSHECHRHRF